jgi:hypothetical protein
MSEKVYAPFTLEQVSRLNEWQRNGNYHPFTCGNRSGHPMDPEGDWGVLVATEEGWHCRHCDYKQYWAHDFMTMTPEEWLGAQS